MVAFLAMDLDGTLVPHTLKISERNLKAVQAAREAGILVTVATGRMSPSASPYIKELGIDLPIITYNGAMITDMKTGKVLREEPLGKEVVKPLLELCREKGWYIQAYKDDRLLIYEENEKSRMYSRIAGVPAEVIGDELWQMERATKLLSIADNDEEQAEMAATFREYFGDKGNVAESLGSYVEITSLGAEKGKAVAFLCNHYGIPMSQVMAIGDGGNDIGMIQAAGIGIAMGGAKDKIKVLADGVTADAESDGVALAIEKYIFKL
jgi:HAD-superfamily hydrolase, subfamily IIB